MRQKILTYPEQHMAAALHAVRTDGISVRSAAKMHGVPKTTLGDKLRGATPEGRRMGPDSILTSIEEARLVQ
jgi:lambda repressor-like predicted transcriptional regulator